MKENIDVIYKKVWKRNEKQEEMVNEDQVPEIVLTIFTVIQDHNKFVQAKRKMTESRKRMKSKFRKKMSEFEKRMNPQEEDESIDKEEEYSTSDQVLFWSHSA
jgi:hypothetical protein